MSAAKPGARETGPFSLVGETALVTGGAGGLGLAQAQALARAGATIILADLRDDIVENGVAALAAEGVVAHGVELDVTDSASVTAAFADIEARGIAPTILINNAGVSLRNAAIDATEHEFDLTFGVNVKGTFLVAQAAARLMRERGGGTIVNLASIGGHVVDGPRSSVYDASKAAVVQITKNLAYEWAPFGIRVNGISPGYMRTAMTESLLPDVAEEQRIIDGHIPLGRIGTPKDLEGIVVFLCSPAASYITGHTVLVDGGWLVSF